jgi:hypothetical protein
MHSGAVTDTGASGKGEEEGRGREQEKEEEDCLSFLSTISTGSVLDSHKHDLRNALPRVQVEGKRDRLHQAAKSGFVRN